MNTVSVVIGADICPIGGNQSFFERGDARSLLHDLLPEFEAADLSIANLECPLIDQRAPIMKTGPVFGESSACINGIKQAGIDVLTLANNHIMDHGATGLKNTLKVCAEAGISTVGAGKDLEAARRILVRDLDGIRVGILAVAEHEFSIATKRSWGANPLDPIDYVRNVKQHEDEYDYLVVLLHGGDEFHVPSPRLRDTCRFMIEMGANAVIVQHSHCLGGYEQYQGGHIVYGQGALIMDEGIYRNLKTFHEGFLVKLFIAEDASSKMEFIAFVQSDPAPGARRMGREQEAQFLRRLEEKAGALQNDDYVEDNWLKFCEKGKHAYMSCLLGHNRILAKLNACGFVEKFFYGRKALLRARNIACCETHQEVIDTIFKHRMV